MDLSDILMPPMISADLEGIGGRLKAEVDDFEVEEIPAYEPAGDGGFLYLWVEKRDMGAEFFARQIARRLEIPASEVGMAGLKDRRAVTRQWVSVPASAEKKLAGLEGEGIRVLKVSRHRNKLRAGHLHGNRFNILIRGESQETESVPEARTDTKERVERILTRIAELGMPNFYGRQRFGRGEETLHMGLALLRGEKAKIRNPFLHKLALSAAQSALFNHYLAHRIRDGRYRRVLAGDALSKIPFGGMFVSVDPVADQERFDRREIVTAGPIFGSKTFAVREAAAERESAVLQAFGFTTATFSGFGKLLAGTRRHNLFYLGEPSADVEPFGVRLRFALPAGSYATVFLRELMKRDVVEVEEGESGPP